MSKFAEQLKQAAEQRGIWFPEEDPKADKLVTVQCRIREANYVHDQELIGVVVELPNGEMRSLCLQARLFRFHGRTYEETPAEERVREMEKTAEMFRQSRGRSIRLSLFGHQIES